MICDWSHKTPCKKIREQTVSVSDVVEAGIFGQPCTDGSFNAYPNHCDKYLTCLWGSFAIFNCPPGLHWNDAEKICDWPHKANCHVEGERPTPEPELPDSEGNLNEKSLTSISN